MAHMTLLHLPLELFRCILAEAIRVRGFKRAFRLRLVSRFFATEVIRVVNEFKMLDDSEILICELGNVGADYLSRRLLCTQDPVFREWNNIRPIAARLALEHDAVEYDMNYTTYVKLLTRRAAEYHGVFSMATLLLQNGTDPDEAYAQAMYEYDLMTAAAYTNNLSVIEELSARPANLGITVGAFGNPYEAATTGGHPAALDLLLRKYEMHNPVHGNYTIRRSMLKYVSRHGSPSMTQKVIPPWKPEVFQRENNQQMPQLVAALRTPHVETFNMLMRIKEATPVPLLSRPQLAMLLSLACKKGWQDMVLHLLSQKPPEYGDWLFDYDRDWLGDACECGFEGVTRVLLENGVEIRNSHIGRAAKKGHWGVVRLLVEHGADINQGDPPPIVSAVAFERKDVFLEMVEMGALLEGEIGVKAIEMARREGLESMLSLLGQHGVDISDADMQPLEQGMGSMSI